MNTISIYDRLGENAITQEEGMALYDDVAALLTQGEVVVLDFTNCRYVLSSFLNGVVGQCIRNFDGDFLNEHLKFKAMPKVTYPILRRVIKNAKQYYVDKDMKHE